jgi:hypothetical protein
LKNTNLWGTCRDAAELVGELEFVWNQIKDNSPGSSFSSPKAPGGEARQFEQPTSGTDGPMRILNPMSEQDEAELRSQQQMDIQDGEEDEEEVFVGKKSSRWQKAVERAITNLSAEVAALREQITTGREWRSRKERSWPAWFGWLAWAIFKHIFADFVVLSLVLLWMRRRKDRRLEDLVRASLRLIREYVRKILPSR